MIPDHIPRVRLLDGPTALERMARIAALTGHPSLWVKRDDCMPVAMGGNKVRALEFWAGAALTQGCDTLLAAGRAASNQCRATAAVAAKLGLACIILHNDEEPVEEQGNLLLSRLYGAELRFLGAMDELERSRRLQAAAAELDAAGRRPYVIGADEATGALGYVVAARELAEQAAARGVAFRHVVLPGSMGPTEAGFLVGSALAGVPWTTHLVSIEYGLEELAGHLDRIVAGLVRRIGCAAIDWRRATRLHDRWLGPGYDQPTPEALAAIRTFACHEALLLERTYTSKTFAGLLDLVADGGIARDEPACVIHTGGIPALFGQVRAVAPRSTTAAR